MTYLRALLAVSLFSVATAAAAPVAVATEGPVRVTLYSEPCALDKVVDLPYRATWTEGEQVLEGCYSAHPQFPVVVTYFADKSIILLPRHIFTAVTGV